MYLQGKERKVLKMKKKVLELSHDLYDFVDDAGADLLTTPKEFAKNYGNMDIVQDIEYPEIIYLPEGFLFNK